MAKLNERQSQLHEILKGMETLTPKQQAAKAKLDSIVEEPVPYPWSATPSLLSQGVSLGTSDNIMDAVGMDGEAQRQNVAQAYDANPWIAGATEMVGGLPTGMAGMGRNAVKAGAKHFLGRAAGSGLLQGAVSGAASADNGDYIDRLMGGALGGTLGGAADLGMGLLNRGISRATNSPDSIAARMVNEAATDDGIQVTRGSVDDTAKDYLAGRVDVPSKLDYYRDIQMVPGTPADMGENLRNLSTAAGMRTGRSKAIANDFLEGRERGAQTRALDAIARDLTDEDALDAISTVQASLDNDVAPKYTQVFNKMPPIPANKLEQFAGRPDFDDAYRAAVRNQKNRGGEAPTGDFSFETLNSIQKSLRDKGQTLDLAGTGSVAKTSKTEAANAVNDLRGQVLDVMEEYYPGFSDVRTSWRRLSGLKESVDKGMLAVNKAPTKIRRELQGLSAEEKVAYQTGFAQGLSDQVTKPGRPWNKINRARENIRLVFGSEGDERVKDLIEAAEIEDKQFGQTAQLALAGRGSKTGAVEEAANTGFSEIVTNPSQATLTGLVVDGIKRMNAYAKGQTDKKVRESLARMIYSTDAAEFERGMSALQQFDNSAYSKILRNLIRPAGKTAAQTGIRNTQRDEYMDIDGLMGITGQ